MNMWRALLPLILLCGVGQSSLARKDPAFVPPGSPRWLDTQAGLWTLGILRAPPQCVVCYFQLLGGVSGLCSGKERAERKSEQPSGLAGEMSLLLDISKKSGSATIWVVTCTEGPSSILRRNPENREWKAEHSSLLEQVTVS